MAHSPEQVVVPPPTALKHTETLGRRILTTLVDYSPGESPFNTEQQLLFRAPENRDFATISPAILRAFANTAPRVDATPLLSAWGNDGLITALQLSTQEVLRHTHVILQLYGVPADERRPAIKARIDYTHEADDFHAHSLEIAAGCADAREYLDNALRLFWSRKALQEPDEIDAQLALSNLLIGLEDIVEYASITKGRGVLAEHIPLPL